MWSKQAEAGSKNMTSLKDKITHRKRKGNKSKNAQPVDTNSVNTNTENNKTPKKVAKQNNSRKPTRSANQTVAKSDDLKSVNEISDIECKVISNGEDLSLIEDLIDSEPVDTIYNKDDVSSLTENTDDKIARFHVAPETDAIVLRVLAKDCNDDVIEDRRISDLNNTLKRYSDSFVIAQNNESKNNCDDSKLSRAHSGFFVTDAESCDFNKTDKSGRKSRRFSDIFRYGALKTSNSCDNFSTDDTMLVESGDNGEMTEVTLRNKPKESENDEVDFAKPKKNSKCNSADSKALSRESTVKSKSSKNQKAGTDKNVKVVNSVNSTNSSYLKRVKSKIYKPKSDNGSALPSMPEISEDAKLKKNKSKKTESKPKDNPTELRNSVSHFDFRLLRQNSNLERIRPQALGPKKSTSNVGINDLLDSTANIMNNVAADKPVLAKSKSSSAINLSLLRTRRNKLLEQLKRNTKNVHDEFEFIAFGGLQNTGVQLNRKFGSQNLTSTLDNSASTRPSSWLYSSAGDTKPGHPVTRTGSDRRPDAVREESSKIQDSHNQTPDNEDDSSTTEVSKSLPATTTHKRRNTSNINRSESVKQEQPEKRKQRRNISDPLHNNTSESVDIDHQGLSYQAHSGSSSNTSLSSRSSNDSPSSSLDTVSTFHVGPPAGTGWDSDIEIEDPPDWQSALSEEELSRLQSHEKKRQDVINELFQTERSHLRNLKVLECIFYKPIHEHRYLKTEEINLVFSNLGDLVEIHAQFNAAMKTKKKESVIVKDIGDIVSVMFDGSLGESFQRAAATFCERQQLALEFIKEKRRRDTKFDNTLNEFEKSIHCRRLPLQGFIPSEMQRLSKYPLLLERLIDIVEKNINSEPEYSQAELSKLQLAHDRSKIILNHVNEAAKQALNRARLEEIQNHLDTSQFDRNEVPIVNEFKNLDITKYNLIHEGPMQLKRQNKGILQVHMVLLEEVVILLQREGDRYVLKFFQTGIIGQAPLAPIIKMSALLVRANAALKSSLFLVNTSTQNSQMYELLARDSAERKTWFKHISDAAEAYNKREGKSKRTEPTPDAEEETLHELPSSREVSERAESVGSTESTSGETDPNVHSTESSQRNSDVIEDERDKRLSQSDNDSTISAATASSNTTGGGVSMKFAADDWPLIQPSEVQVEIPPVHTAEPVLTPIEQIKRKDDVVRQALEDKEKLVADFLSIPRDEYHHIADMAGEETRSRDPCEREPSELVLAAVYQVDQLISAVNESLNISDTDPVLMSGGKHPSCASNESLVSKNHMPSVPVNRLQEMATNLSSQLTTLLSVIKQKDEERDRLRKELQKTREQLHEKLSIHGPQYSDIDDVTPHLDSTQSGDLESIEESPTENEST